MARISLEPWPLHARCPGCGEVASHKALRVDADGTRHLRCKACGHEWERERGRALGTPRRAETFSTKKEPKKESLVVGTHYLRESP